MSLSVLVTGSNRGIGLELVRHLLLEKHCFDHVFATCRNPDGAKELTDLQKTSPNLHVLQLDVSDESSYPRLVGAVSDVVQERGLNLLINNAGITGARTNLASITSDNMVDVFKTNCVAPLMLTKALLPLLKQAADCSRTFTGDVMSWKRAAVVNISSRVASIDDNRSGGMYAYRTSKVALNGLGRSMGIDLRPDHVLVVSIDPGWVKTDMGGPNAKITTTESAQRIVATMATLGAEHTSLYLDNFGKSIPW